MIPASNLKTYLQLVFELRRFLREPLSLEQCKEIVKRRLEEREKNFIGVAKRTIYENERSPYLKLLGHAGCEFGDFRGSILREGIEKTLEELRASGVYLTYDEFKGRREVVRNGKTFKFEQSDFNNPILSHHLTIQTGGTTGKGVEVPVGFDLIAQTAVYRALLFDIHELREIPFALWFPILPGSAGLAQSLANAKIGLLPSKWFSQVDREYIKPSFKHKLRTNGFLYVGRIFGTRFPKPEYVDLNNAGKVAAWAAKMTKEYPGCCIATYPSSAVRICLAAIDRGLCIEGLKFIVSGEPLTTAKHKKIRSTGADTITQYTSTETWTIGFGCAKPQKRDEVHFFKDSLALIQHERKIPLAESTVNAFLFTSLLPRAPKILLNVEIGDYGTVNSRKCGCGYEDLGFKDHIYSIRSFEKLTSEGMNLAEADLTRIIDEVLPQKFGGDSTDYQIVEEEDEKGLTRLNIIASPRIGEISERELLNTVLSELKPGKSKALIPEIFFQVETFRVKRTYPISTKMGKILPLHIQRKRNDS
jgi:hypothetical protein